jgi:hypothetical protein
MFSNPTMIERLKSSAVVVCLAVGLVLKFAAPVSAATDTWNWQEILDNQYYKVYLNIRARIEVADFDGLDQSEAYTVRSRFGIRTKPWHGISLYAEGENILSLDDGEYFDGVESPTGQSVIADPEETELNQLYLHYENRDLLGLKFTGGRQRIQLDDDRFIGNVGWRQNEQTYDAIRLSFSPVEHLTVMHSYIWDVRRIFGKSDLDFDSQSNLVHITYDRWAAAKIVLFAYFLDFDNRKGNSAGVFSSNSYGLRVTGEQAIGGPWGVSYAASYAVQEDAGDNPADYTAHYVRGEGGLGYSGLGKVAVGYELLGSDNGKAVFGTPLATLHAHNGWADAFLDNGGPNGLQDLYVSVAPNLPWGLKGQAVYHHFWSDEGQKDLADEVDVVVTKPINKHLSVLTKAAWFDGESGSGRTDRWRWWLMLTFNY